MNILDLTPTSLVKVGHYGEDSISFSEYLNGLMGEYRTSPVKLGEAIWYYPNGSRGSEEGSLEFEEGTSNLGINAFYALVSKLEGDQELYNFWYADCSDEELRWLEASLVRL